MQLVEKAMEDLLQERERLLLAFADLERRMNDLHRQIHSTQDHQKEALSQRLQAP